MNCTICGDKGTICYEGKITACACQGDPCERIAALEAENQRLSDLVRYARHMLFEEDVIDEIEFAELVADAESGQRVARLGGYDKLRAEIAELKAQLHDLKQATRLVQESALKETARLDWVLENCLIERNHQPMIFSRQGIDEAMEDGRR